MTPREPSHQLWICNECCNIDDEQYPGCRAVGCTGVDFDHLVGIADYDTLSARLKECESKLAVAREALGFYAQEPVKESGTQWSDSCEAWGVESQTWEPLIDRGDRARSALEKLGGG